VTLGWKGKVQTAVVVMGRGLLGGRAPARAAWMAGMVAAVLEMAVWLVAVWLVAVWLVAVWLVAALSVAD